MTDRPKKAKKPIIVYRWKKAVAVINRPKGVNPTSTKPTIAEIRKSEKNRKEREKWLRNTNRYFDRSMKKNTNESTEPY